MELLILCLFGDLSSAKRTLLIDEQGLHDAFVTEMVIAVGSDGPEESFIADGTLILVFQQLLFAKLLRLALLLLLFQLL
jgi:hypothetical protein